jgi:hypothetical protein
MPYYDARGSFHIPRYILNENNADWFKENGLECDYFKESKRELFKTKNPASSPA